MTFKDTTARSQNEVVSIEIDLPHPPQKVWRALTIPELLCEWLLPVVDHQLETGAAFQFRAPPKPGWDGAVNCTYLQIEEPSKISWAWVVGEIDTVVEVKLTPTESGTRLSLTQSGFKPHQKQNFGGARYGWKMMADKLIDLLATVQ
jgi:uncharacterized protein YndB with AHSA1/START domain